jgi:hypothetical protein
MLMFGCTHSATGSNIRYLKTILSNLMSRYGLKSISRKKNEVGSVGVTTAEVFGGKRLTQAVLSGRGVCRVGKKEMSARNLHFFYFIYF